MPHDNRTIIAEPLTSAGRRLAAGVLIGSLVIGVLAAVHYALADLTLSHYDARAHLVVARRIIDSITPGWKQIGAVWLPLPHLINMPIVQWDWAYRTGYPSTALSILAVAIGLSALSAVLFRRTGSAAAAIAGPTLILLNPNVLYLQSTPMTEPLLIGLSLISVYCVDRWISRGDRASLTQAGLAIMALALTRYEGWLVAGTLVVFGALGRRRDGFWRALGLAPYLAAAIAAFLLLGKGATGVWFVTSGFFEPDLDTLSQLGPSLLQVLRGTHQMGGSVLLIAGAAGVIAALLTRRVDLALVIALLAAAVLPLYAFYQGHPFRIRYMVPVVVAMGALSAVAIARVPRRMQWPVAALVVAAVIWQSPPLNPRAPMVVEAQWETPYRRAREEVTRHLVASWDGTPILASMGSLGHYMQEASHAGFSVADFIHEGNGEIWTAARQAPARYARWMLIEENAEGGDMFAVLARADERFLDGLERVAEGGGVALYRRKE